MPPMPEGAYGDRTEQLMRYITGARWFAGKGRQAVLRSLAALPWLTSPAEWPAVRLEIAEVGYPADAVESAMSGPSEFYTLAIAYRQSPVGLLNHAEIARFDDSAIGSVVGYDAMQDPDACRVILGQLISEAWHRDAEAAIRFHLRAAEKLTPDLEPHIHRGQQSNTSVMFGDVVMIKLFRRLELGRNLDIEVHDALSRSHVADVAQLYGWVEGSWRTTGQTRHADLAMAVEKLAGAHDGWALALHSLRQEASFASEAHALGTALAETHSALREAFPTAQASGVSVAAVMRERLDRAMATAAELAPYAPLLQQLFDQLGPESLPLQRVHGDFHLGQTLHTPRGWKIIDFEGEPAKSLAERAAPDSVWRDIAGMLRSFDYAAASAPGPGSGAWRDECRSAFLDSYAGGQLKPAEVATVRAYEADKAVYELIYEIRNRPNWVDIPLAAIATLAESPTGKGNTSNGHSDPTPKPADSGLATTKLKEQ
jgi:maltokinase